MSDFNTNLQFKLLANASQFQSELRGARKSFDGFVGGLNKLAGLAAGGFLVSEFAQFSKQIFTATAEVDKLQAVLANTLGSDAKAAQTLERLAEFARANAKDTTELTNAYVKLANQGFKPTTQELRQLADLASSTGKSFDQLAEAVLDAQTAEFERLKEFGIRAKNQGDVVAFTFKGVTTEVENTSDAIRNYVTGLGNVEGVAGSTAAVSKTLAGQIEAFEGNINALRVELGRLVQDEGAQSLSFLSSLTAELTDYLAKVNNPAGRFQDLVNADGSYADQEKALARLIIKQEQLRKRANELSDTLVQPTIIQWLKEVGAAIEQQRTSMELLADAGAEGGLQLVQSFETLKSLREQLSKLEAQKLNAPFEDVARINDDIEQLTQKIKKYDEATNQAFSKPQIVGSIEGGGFANLGLESLSEFGPDAITKVEALAEKGGEVRSAFDDAALSITQFSDTLSRSFANGANVFEAFKNAALASLAEIAAALIKQAILSTLVTALLPGLGFTKIAGSLGTLGKAGAFGSLFNFDVPGLSTGGLVMKRGVFEIAEGGQPEAVIPLNRLEQMVNQGGKNVNVRGEFKLRGEDLFASIRETQDKYNRLF